ncbi:MAG TPA: hypothetical protein VHD33_02815 [Legionellaceae bacterium]|nr:hypothetical protein [Legionellaceae bacterium]
MTRFQNKEAKSIGMTSNKTATTKSCTSLSKFAFGDDRIFLALLMTSRIKESMLLLLTIYYKKAKTYPIAPHIDMHDTEALCKYIRKQVLLLSDHLPKYVSSHGIRYSLLKAIQMHTSELYQLDTPELWKPYEQPDIAYLTKAVACFTHMTSIQYKIFLFTIFIHCDHINEAYEKCPNLKPCTADETTQHQALFSVVKTFKEEFNEVLLFLSSDTFTVDHHYQKNTIHPKHRKLEVSNHYASLFNHNNVTKEKPTPSTSTSTILSQTTTINTSSSHHNAFQYLSDDDIKNKDQLQVEKILSECEQLLSVISQTPESDNELLEMENLMTPEEASKLFEYHCI